MFSPHFGPELHRKWAVRSLTKRNDTMQNEFGKCRSHLARRQAEATKALRWWVHRSYLSIKHRHTLWIWYSETELANELWESLTSSSECLPSFITNFRWILNENCIEWSQAKKWQTPSKFFNTKKGVWLCLLAAPRCGGAARYFDLL